MSNHSNLKAITILLSSGILFNPIGYAQDPGYSANGMAMNQDHTAPAISDNAIQSSIKSSLPSFAKNVKVKVTNGIVYLTGKLNSNTDYENVVTLAQSTHGVSDINVDNLTVKDSHDPLSESFMTAKIKGALLKSDLLGKDIPSWSVHVETKNGQVYLSGTVASPEERKNVLDVVKSIKGVTTVNDQMVAAE